MKQTITIDPEAIHRARQSKTGPNPMAVQKWSTRLAHDAWFPDYAAEDALVECAPIHGNSDLVQHLTGIAPTMMSRHPGRASSTLRGEAYPAAVVAVAFLNLHRLGVNIPALELVEPLRATLTEDRKPLVSTEELDVLWAKGRAGIPWAFTYKGAMPPSEPYAEHTHDGRAVIGFPSRGECVEVVGKRGVYAEAGRAGCTWSRHQLQKIVRRCEAVCDV